MSVNTTEDFKSGHRQRLRTRFLKGGDQAIEDYELLEMLLFGANSRQDMKPLAHRLLRHFGSLSAVFNAPFPEFSRVTGATPAVVAVIKMAQGIHHRLLRAEIQDRPLVSSWEHVLDYCYATMSHLQNEQLLLLFLDNKNKIIKDEVQQVGTVNQTSIYTREVLKRALELGASGIILVHNHPSGDPTPSEADILITQQLDRAAHAMGIALHDHLIIGHQRYISLRAEGILK